MLKWLLLALLAILALLAWRRSTTSNRNLPRAGSQAPDFELPDQTGAMRSLFSWRGHWLVLYFYPRDDTPG